MQARQNMENHMAPHQERVVTEKAELDEKLTKLNAFFDTSIFAGLDPAEQDRLRKQSMHMTDYSNVLGERIAAF
jgi:hypothetical protein